MPTTKDLIKAQRAGARIRTNQGTDVGYFPRHPNDKIPWLMKGWPDQPRYRRGAANCVAETSATGGIE
jgi:hypothetical protein